MITYKTDTLKNFDYSWNRMQDTPENNQLLREFFYLKEELKNWDYNIKDMMNYKKYKIYLKNKNRYEEVTILLYELRKYKGVK